VNGHKGIGNDSNKENAQDLFLHDDLLLRMNGDVFQNNGMKCVCGEIKIWKKENLGMKTKRGVV